MAALCPPAVEAALIRALDDPAWRVRRAAAVALHDAGLAREQALAVLLGGARTPSERVSADDAVVALREPPREVIEAPWRVACDPAAPEHARCAAAVRFLRVIRGRPEHADRLWALLDSEDEPVRVTSAHYLRRRRPPPATFLKLAEALHDAAPALPAVIDPRTGQTAPFGRRGRALATLELWRDRGRGRPPLCDSARPCIEGLLAAARDADVTRRRQAVAVLGLWARERADVLRTIVQALEDPCAEVRRAATGGLERCDDQREALMRAALDPDINVRLGAVFPLLTLTPCPDVELPFWRRVLAEPALAIGEYAIDALARLSGVDDELIALLEPHCADPDRRIAGAADRALIVPRNRRFARVHGLPEAAAVPAADGPARARDGVAALVVGLGSAHPRERLRAVQGLVRLGPGAAPAAVALAEAATRTRSLRLRRRAARLLGEVGSAAAIPALLTLLVHERAPVRSRAARALGRLVARPVADEPRG